MSINPLTCDITTIQEMEVNYKLRLSEDPANMELRQGLAWCLFMHSLHEAGRESLIDTIATAVKGAESDAVFEEVRLLDQKAYRLLRACLLETFTILQLSPQSNAEVAKLHELVRMAGSNQALQDAEDDALKILERLSRDVARSLDCQV